MSAKHLSKKEDIFENELLPHVDALTTFAFHLTYNEEDARDLVQETFLKAYKSIDSYAIGTNSKAWLFKILKNAYINEYRKKSKRPTEVDFEDFLAYLEKEDLTIKGSQDFKLDMYQNLIGDEVERWRNLSREANACIHLYGKRDALPGRKMGHVTQIT